MKKGIDPIVVLVLVFVIGFVITGISKTEFASAQNPPTASIARG